MSADFLLKTAAVLEAAAAVIDEHEAKTREAVKIARENSLKAVTEQYTRLTGEELPSELASKLASSDESVLGAVQQVFTKTAGTVESLGHSTTAAVERRPTNKKESAEAAWARFGTFITS